MDMLDLNDFRDISEKFLGLMGILNSNFGNLNSRNWEF
jgi:hypothetical protein